MAASPSLSRLRRKAKRSRLKRTNRVSLKAIRDLLAQIDAMPKTGRVPADVFSEYRSVLNQMARRLRILEQLQVRTASRLNVTRWRQAQGVLIGNVSRDAPQVLAMLLNRRWRGSNVHAMAQGKLTAQKLGIEHYKAIGRKGAAVRWARERAKKQAQDTQVIAQIARS